MHPISWMWDLNKQLLAFLSTIIIIGCPNTLYLYQTSLSMISIIDATVLDNSICLQDDNADIR